MRSKKDKGRPTEPLKPLPKGSMPTFHKRGDPAYSEPWTVLIGGLKGQDSDEQPTAPKPKEKPKTFAEPGIKMMPDDHPAYSFAVGDRKRYHV